VNGTTVAASAAVLSFLGVLLNIYLTSRLAGKSQREQWRRDQERPIVARMITLSQDALAQWHQAARARWAYLDAVKEAHDRGTITGGPDDRACAAGSERYENLRADVAELDLIAGQPVRDVAHQLVQIHEGCVMCCGSRAGTTPRSQAALA
jgi:hypothetical protein